MNGNIDTNDICKVRTAICELIDGLSLNGYALHSEHWHNCIWPELENAIIKAKNSANFEIKLYVHRGFDGFHITSNLPSSRFDTITVDEHGQWLNNLRDSLLRYNNYSAENYRVDMGIPPIINSDESIEVGDLATISVDTNDIMENLNSINTDENELNP